ncbi:MAG: DNA primase [Eubacteriales bacterium]|nr:DNA primase [Eubacteriales bacterium]
MAFSKVFLEEIKERNDIEEVVNRYVPLKRAGSNMNGLCPFHSEKTPSFTIFPATQNFYCFGCGTGGDVVTFIMRIEGLDYPAAVEYLARRAGIPMEENNGYGIIGTRAVKKERIIEATREACRFFHSELFTEKGETARAYIEKRQLSDLTVRRFGIGYAPDSWDMLSGHLAARGYTVEEMKSAFLVGISKNGNPYDVFRNRLMFPVFDLTGNPVAFSARRLNEEDDRKYVNTSDTPAFKKSKVLFAMNIAKNSSDGSLILCEGAVDAVMLHQAGFSNACATLGTAITDDHARIIARIAKTVYLAYDIDKAGRSATEKAINKLNEVGIATKIINLGSDTKDPDEFIKKYGADAFKRRINQSEGQSEYSINQIINKYSLDIPDEKAMAAREICSYLAAMHSKTDLEIYAAMAAAKLGIGKAMLLDDTERYRRSNIKKDQKRFNEKAIHDIEGFGDRVNRDRVRFSAAASIEEKILGILLLHPELGPYACEKLTADSFVTEFNKKAFEFFEEDFRSGRLVNLSRDGFFDQNEISCLVKLTAARELFDDNSQTVLDEYIEKLARQKEMRDADKKIEENPIEGLTDYIEQLRKRKK